MRRITGVYSYKHYGTTAHCWVCDALVEGKAETDDSDDGYRLPCGHGYHRSRREALTNEEIAVALLMMEEP